MDCQTFLQRVPSHYYQWGQASVQLKSDRFQTVLPFVWGKKLFGDST
ncbi:MAG: hypothetical protein RBJ76_24050 [Stenomitos frigidus ULC029]